MATLSEREARTTSSDTTVKRIKLILKNTAPKPKKIKLILKNTAPNLKKTRCPLRATSFALRKAADIERRESAPTTVEFNTAEGYDSSNSVSAGQKRKRTLSGTLHNTKVKASLTVAAITSFQKSPPKAPAKDLFADINHNSNKVAPEQNGNWGTHPWAIPYDHLGSPPARLSNAQVTPSLFEDRKSRFVTGQFQKVNGKIINQASKLVLPLMDMRADKKSSLPRNQPIYWSYPEPKNWNDPRSIKILNDRRREAIKRVTCDVPWEQEEREYLVELFQEKPDISIKELAERFNYRFRGDFIGDGFCGHPLIEVQVNRVDLDELRGSRTLECIRAEYLEHKAEYDAGIVPEIKKTGRGQGTKKEGLDALNGAISRQTPETQGSFRGPKTPTPKKPSKPRVRKIPKAEKTKVEKPKCKKSDVTNFAESFTLEERSWIAEITSAYPKLTMLDLKKQFNRKCEEMDLANNLERRKGRTLVQIKEEFKHFEGLYRKGITPGGPGYEAFVKDPSEAKMWYELSEDENMYGDEEEEEEL
ncbi:hypothetical protein AOQ84DRAFT_423606 [Glonium stellatum]|uniref:Uncharacterized protein n=1 Tax=Glonium stellatum TaxID=574774 RepID=A0A8E2EQ56_9PEZI|nr:hypothetical protein AOQ84DRAFT_423606 [Glonium stellatum]